MWRQVESFAGYAFAKGHSASFAVESYQSLFLKAYWPLEYRRPPASANFGGYVPDRVPTSTRPGCWSGRFVRPASTRGGYLAGYDPATRTLTLGFNLVKGVEGETAVRIERERHHAGPYRDLEDLVRRTGIGLEQLLTVIRIGGLRWTGRSKQQLQWEAHFLLGHPCASRPRLARPLPRGRNRRTLGPASAHRLALEGGSGEGTPHRRESGLLGFPLFVPVRPRSPP